ncbi:MAG: PDZ domain-containing protein [Actinobacteria bacterium]|nr:PDZ domain-containing protein [Actinomycetota bacterium]
MRHLSPFKVKLPLLSKILFIAIVLVAFFVPTPYVLMSPGTPQNILGDAISITGAQSFPTTGKLSVTSVMVTNPDSYITGFDILAGWITADEAVLPRAEIYPENETAEQSNQQGAADMQESQVNATSAALSLLGYKSESKLIINSINPNSNAFKQLLTGDQIISIDQKVLTSATQITEYLGAKQAGDTVNLKVIRSTSGLTNGATPIDVPVKLSKRDDGSAYIGVNIETKHNFPVNVKIKLDETGGPSGGLIFALGIVEKLQSEDLIRGRNIAGTGTITDTGKVGPIGGITEKIIGAKKAGVTLFIAPIDNCSDITHPELLRGIKVVPVATLSEAIAVLRAPDNADFASCKSS